MAQQIGLRGTPQAITNETSLVRYFDIDDILLEPDEGPLLTFYTGMKRNKPCDSPRIEWLEDDFTARWTQNGSAAIANTTASTTITVTDDTLFVIGDVVQVPNAPSSATAPELFRVTAKPGSNALTVTRAFAGTTAQTIAADAALNILGPAYSEGQDPPVAKTTLKVPKISYTEIFRKTDNITWTQAASKIYGADSGERDYQQKKLLKELKISMNRSFLWGKASESLSGPDGTALRTTMGFNSVVTTNVTDANGVLTRKAFENFSQTAFRYGSREKMLLASPRICSAIHHWGNQHLQLSPNEKVFGVNINRLIMGNGTWMLVRDWMLEDGVSGKNGFAGTAFSLDIDDIVMYHLAGNGYNYNLQLLENVVKGTGAHRYVDEAFAECGLKIAHEKKHAVLKNVTDYQE